MRARPTLYQPSPPFERLILKSQLATLLDLFLDQCLQFSKIMVVELPTLKCIYFKYALGDLCEFFAGLCCQICFLWSISQIFTIDWADFAFSKILLA